MPKNNTAIPQFCEAVYNWFGYGMV